MYERPLFPLNVVLFPGQPLHLHIFEERYKLMMRLCLESKRIFGICLIQKGMEALGPLPEPHQTGCLVRIADVQPLDEGRLNIMVVGQERFQITSLDWDSAPYLIGHVEPFPLKVIDSPGLRQGMLNIKPRIERYVELLNRLSEASKAQESLPDEPELVAYLASILLQLPQNEKQVFLEIEEAGEYLAQLLPIYDRELALMRAMLSESSRTGIGVFSRN
jgi:Lon protease-like protein